MATILIFTCERLNKKKIKCNSRMYSRFKAFHTLKLIHSCVFFFSLGNERKLMIIILSSVVVSLVILVCVIIRLDDIHLYLLSLCVVNCYKSKKKKGLIFNSLISLCHISDFQFLYFHISYSYSNNNANIVLLYYFFSILIGCNRAV